MKRIILNLTVFFVFYHTASAQLGIGTSNPDSSAILDVFSDNKGFLPPRISLTAANVPTPVNKPAVGLLIYNTASAGPDSAKVVPGYYYWNGAMWYSLSRKGDAVGDMEYWNGKQWMNIPVGANRSVLTLCNGIPRWGNCTDSIIYTSGASGNNAMYVTYNDQDPNWATGNVYNNTYVNQELAVAATTAASSSASVISRAFIAFDMSSLPTNAEIVSAKLSLYGLASSNTIPQGNVGVNNLFIQRVTDNWNQTSINWNNQPATTIENQIELPQTTSVFNYNVTGIDVTNLVKAMRLLTPSKTAGFCLRLKYETLWRSVIFASNRHVDVAKRPKLEIVYR